MTDSAPPPDAQSRAFRDAGPADWTSPADLFDLAEPFDLGNAHPPEEWERWRWDYGREPAKTAEEARAAAAARGDDPSAYGEGI